MGQMILLRRPSDFLPRGPFPGQSGSQRDPSAAARGILLALALSSLAWIAIALLVPRLW
jgi:hypothetical protein